MKTNKMIEKSGGLVLSLVIAGSAMSLGMPEAYAEQLPEADPAESPELSESLLEERLEQIHQQVDEITGTTREERIENAAERLEQAEQELQQRRESREALGQELRENLQEDAGILHEQVSQELEQADLSELLPQDGKEEGRLYERLADAVVSVREDEKLESDYRDRAHVDLSLNLPVDLNTDDFLCNDTIHHDINITVESEMNNRSFDNIGRNNGNAGDKGAPAAKGAAEAAPQGKPGTGMVADPSWYSLRSDVPYTGDGEDPGRWAALAGLSLSAALAAFVTLSKKRVKS